MSFLLEVQDLRVSYHTYAGEVQAVRGVSFSLEEKEILAIVGESGCGKSVTAKSIMALIKEPPGEIKPGSRVLFNGKDILQCDAEWLRSYRGRDCAMIFQDPMASLNPTMKVGRQIAESIVAHSALSVHEAELEAVRLLSLVEIQDPERRARQYPHELSGGMRQRVMIAIAFSCRPKLIVADEPTTALDVTIQSRIMDLIGRMYRELGTSVILITHDLGIVAGAAKNIIVMYAGKIVERGGCRDIFYHPRHPYTRALLASLPRLDMPNKASLPYIHGTPPDLLLPPPGCPFSERCGYCMNICLEREPPAAVFPNGQEASCWLHHPGGPGLPEGIL
jgi:oligopeptide transport system ATP-binding protein